MRSNTVYDDIPVPASVALGDPKISSAINNLIIKSTRRKQIEGLVKSNHPNYGNGYHEEEEKSKTLLSRVIGLIKPKH